MTQKASPAEKKTGIAFIKAISEALFMAVAVCMKKEGTIAKSIRDNLHPLGSSSYTVHNPDTKLLISLLSGGKAAGSPVKFAKFYLIIDASKNVDANIPAVFKAFVTALKSKFTVGKGGDSAFKLMPDGSFFNAYGSVADSLKFIEEAINVSGANGARPGTQPGSAKRVGTAGTDKSKAEEEEKTGEVHASACLFRIGVNCDGDSSFNKDPKDPNKYEIDGVKGQNSQQ